MNPATFQKPESIRDLELLHFSSPSVPSETDCPAGRYPEVFFRVKVRLSSPEAIYSDDEALVRSSSPLFWEEGTPAQILLAATVPGGGAWTLSLTRWGVLRRECRANGEDPAVSLEPKYYSTQSLIALDHSFYAGLTLSIARGGADAGRMCVRLFIGQSPGQNLCLIASKSGIPAGNLQPLPVHLTIGRGANGNLPLQGEVEDLLVANSDQARLFDDIGGNEGLDASFPGGSCLWSRRLGTESLVVSPGAEFASTGGNYWYFFTVTDPAVRRIRFQRLGDMSTSFFVSEDRRSWKMVPATIVGGDMVTGSRDGEVELPERKGPLLVANAPLYGEIERDRDLTRAKDLGADVCVVAKSTLGLPVHLVTVTDPSVPLAEKTAVVLLCGQHSPVEQMGGMLGLPCIEEIVRLHEQGEAQGLLRSLVFYWVPIFNIDCAHYGTPGNDARLLNPNRCWFTNHGPEQTGVEDFFLARKREGLRMAFMMDIHVGSWRNHTLLTDYDCEPENPSIEMVRGIDLQKQAIFAKLHDIAGLREVWANGRSGPKRRAPEWFQETFACPGFTIECSVVSHFDPVSKRTLPFTQESFFTMGTNLGKFIASHVCAMNEKPGTGNKPD